MWNDLVNYSGFYNDIVDRTKAGQAGGQSVDQVISSYSVPSRYSDFVAESDMRFASRLQSTVQYIFDGQ